MGPMIWEMLMSELVTPIREPYFFEETILDMLPFVYKYKESNGHLSMLGLFLGMFVMALSLLLL